jgi:hypothetical protein
MSMKVWFAVSVLSYAPLACAESKPEYPSDKVAQFVIDKLDVTSLPSSFRPRKEKGKKTFSDYGFTAMALDDNDALIESAGGAQKLAIKVLERKSSGIYVCIAQPAESGRPAAQQTVIVLKRKDPNALLRGRESFQEFAACPAIGGGEATDNSNAG